FKKLIHRTHATWQTDKSLRVLQKHGLARKEIAEINAEVDVLIKPLLKGKFNAQAHGKPTGFISTTVSSFHDSGATTGYHSIIVLHQLCSQIDALCILRRIFLRARRTIYGHGFWQVAQCIKSRDKFTLDTQYTPRI